jgi:hypothetical protein
MIAFGGLAIGAAAVGGLAIGRYALGGKAIGDFVLSAERQDVEAARFFDAWFRLPLRLFAAPLLPLIDRVLGR